MYTYHWKISKNQYSPCRRRTRSIPLQDDQNQNRRSDLPQSLPAKKGNQKKEPQTKQQQNEDNII